MSPLVTWNAQGVAAWADAAGTDVVLVQCLRGFIDAGRTGRALADHLSSLSEPIRVATFDVDSLLDYRSRRPEMTFSINQWTAYEEPSLAIDMMRDVAGTPFLVLNGLEPDVRWDAFILAVKEAAGRLGVRLTVGAHGIPMGVPHTKPITATIHGTKPDLLPDAPSYFGTVTVPASVQSLLEYRFGQWGMDAATVAVHVPYYLAQSAFPQATQHAIGEIEKLTGLALNSSALDADAAAASVEIERQMAESDEVQALVLTLESQHEAILESRGEGILLDGTIPTADELGAEFERFLAQERRDQDSAE